MPFVNYGGPIGSESAIVRIVDEAVAIARRDKVKLLEMRSRIPLDIDLSASHRKITVVLDLPPTPEALFQKFTSKLRSQIRRPQKEGVTVVFGPEQVESFFAVFAAHMRDLGTPTQSLAFFREIVTQFPDDCWFACAYLAGAPVAAGCGFQFSRSAGMNCRL